MNRFKELRIEHGFKSQQDLASVLFVNQTAVSQWERGITTPSSPILLKLSQMYGVSTDYLLGRTDQKEQLPANDEELNARQKEAVQFIKGLSDEQLIRFIRLGRAAFEAGGENP